MIQMCQCSGHIDVVVDTVLDDTRTPSRRRTPGYDIVYRCLTCDGFIVSYTRSLSG